MTDTSPRTPNPLRWALLAALALVVVFAASYAVATIATRAITPGSARAGAPTSALTPDPNMDLLAIPPFALVDQRHRPFTESDLRGKLTVMDFFFSSCPFVCTTLTPNMKRIQDAVRDPRVQCVSVSVDPEHDTPEWLHEYGDIQEIDHQRWRMLSGDLAQVNRIIAHGLKLNPLETVEGMTFTAHTGEPMANISHPSHFVLIGPTGEVLGLYSGLQRAQVDELIERLRAGLDELDSSRARP